VITAVINLLAAAGAIYMIGTLIVVATTVWWTIKNVRAVRQDDERE
jgi:hypothetical protein